jgi:quercetin dioxygenase-like cupin family protein
MQPIVHHLIKAPLLLSAFIFAGWSQAADLPDLLPAFEAGWKGGKTCELLYETDSVRVGYCSFPPGTGHEKHFHHPHFGYVLEGGLLRITDAEGGVEERQTTTGKSWSTSGITIHEALNIGATTTSYLIVEPKS